MATNLTDIIKKVRTALRGEEVRGSIADGLEYCGQISENAKADMEATASAAKEAISETASDAKNAMNKTASDAKTTIETSAASTKEQLSKDIDAKAAAALKSIPESYTELDGSVKQLKEDVEELYENEIVSVDAEWEKVNDNDTLSRYFTYDEIKNCIVKLLIGLPSSRYIVVYFYDSSKKQVSRINYYSGFNVSKFLISNIAFVRIEIPSSIIDYVTIWKPRKVESIEYISDNLLNVRDEDLSYGEIDIITGNIERSSTYIYTPILELEPESIYDIVRIDKADINVFEHFNYLTYALYDLNGNFIQASSVDFAKNRQSNHYEYVNDVYIHTRNAHYVRLCFTHGDYFNSREVVLGNQDYINSIIGNNFMCIPYYDSTTFFHITDIENPFISKQNPPRNYIHLKFDNIVYENGYKTFRYTWDMFKKDVTASGLHGCIFIDYTKNASTVLSIPKPLEVDDNGGYGKIVFNMAIGKAKNVLKTYENDKNEVTLAIFDSDKTSLNGVLHDFYELELHDTRIIERNRLKYDTIQAIKNREYEILSSIDSDNFNFAYFTDGHASFVESMAVNMVCKDLNPDCIICGGDTDLGTTGLGALKVISEFLGRIEQRKKLIYAEGNHDRGVSDTPLNRKEIFTLTVGHLMDDANVTIVASNRMYYYKDFHSKKIRVISLTLYNTDNEDYNDSYGWDGEQMEWFANTALSSTPSDYHVIVVAHCAPLIDSDGWGGILNHPNKNVCKGILESFVSGTSVTLNGNDTSTYITPYSVTTHFTKAGNLIGMFTGHGHIDKYLNLNNVNYIETDCGYIDTTQDVYPDERYPLTYTEVAIDYVSVDTKTRKVNLKRIGYGNDREYTY